jgi:hypothetical protein
VKRVPYYRWWIPDERRPGKVRLTSWRMSEKEAQGYPGAKPDESDVEWRDIAETEDERIAAHSHSVNLPKRR